MTDTHTIARTGLAPLVFSGDVVASSAERQSGGGRQWHTITVYKVAGGFGGYVVVVAYQHDPDLRHEVARTDAWRVGTLTGVENLLCGWDATRAVHGYAPGSKNHRAKQQALLDNIQSRFEVRVSAVLAELGVEASE